MRPRLHFRLRFIALASMAAIVGTAAASRRTHAEVCAPSDLRSELGYLRRLSFDLRGHAPTYEELEKVATVDKRVPAERVDSMIAEPAHTATMRAFFRQLLSVNLSHDFGSELHLLVTTEAGSNFPPSQAIYWNPNRARGFRGGNQSVPCRDVPATFATNGQPDTVLDADFGSGAQREGFVEIHPYWASDANTTVKVCAFDASTKAVSTLAPTTGQRCDERTQAKDCGCGPEGRVCSWRGPEVPQSSTNVALNQAFIQQALRAFDRIIADDLPYTELFTSRDLEISGPIAHFLRYQARATSIGFYARPDIGIEVPAIPFTATTTWTRVPQSGQVAGILTSPFYLVKYSSNRARANRFYNAFLCSYFEASAAGLPDPSDACTQEPNITERCGCKDCHTKLEPAASHWGRWAERGIHPLPASEWPRLDPACAGPSPPASCEDFRFVASEVNHPKLEPYKGVLRSYVFAEPFQINIEAGPQKIAADAIASGALASCTTARFFTRFVGRPPSDWPEERAAVDRIATRFAEGYSLRTLVKDLVTMPQYKVDR